MVVIEEGKVQGTIAVPAPWQVDKWTSCEIQSFDSHALEVVKALPQPLCIPSETKLIARPTVFKVRSVGIVIRGVACGS